MRRNNNKDKGSMGSHNLKVITIFIFIFLVGTSAFGAVIYEPNYLKVSIISQPNPIKTRAPYELNLEVDYFEGFLYPEVIEAFTFLESYFQTRGILVDVDFNSTNHIIEGNPYVDLNHWRTINRQYHDRSNTHIHVILAKSMVPTCSGFSNPYFGAGVSLEVTGHNYTCIRMVIMHEIGHCIGIGIQDDGDNGEEVYSQSGFMSNIWSNDTEYFIEDWNSSFAPDGAFGNITWKSARIWNQFSVYGELYDDTADVTGRLTNVTRNLLLKEIDGPNEYVAVIDIYNGHFYFQPHPGNYTLKVFDPEYQLSKAIFVNVSERQVLNLGNISIEPILTQPIETPANNKIPIFMIVVVIGIVTALIALTQYRKYARGQ